MRAAMANKLLHVNFVLVMLFGGVVVNGANGKDYVSAVGDPGMKRDGLRVGFEAWNFCNEVGEEAPGMGSPRAADCFDLSSKHRKSKRNSGALDSECLFC